MKLSFLIVLIFLSSAFAAGFLFLNNNFEKPREVETSETSNVLKIGNAAVKIDIVDTPPERARGLSGIDSIEDDEGMLFVFGGPRRYSFWMKDMRFPIDIVWIGEDRRVVDITENLRPESYPAQYQPREPAQYVLEVNTGWARRHNIEIENEVILPNF